MSTVDVERLRSIKTFPSLVKYLRDELDWPIESDDFDELTFDYEPEDLGLDAKTAVKIKEIKQLRPLVSGQPWGIFFINFEPKRLPVVVLRRILRSLVIKKRQSANKPQQAAWQLHDLLFISAYGESEHRDITLANFSDDSNAGDLPTLKVLGWDDEDTVRHLAYSHDILKEKLHWPDNPADLAHWRQTWSQAFTLKHHEAIGTSKEMAERMAELATAIRNRVNRVLTVESEKGPMRKLMTAFREALIHDLKPDDFADMYAQTITYGLLSACVSRPAGLVADNIRDMVPITNPFLRDLLSTFLTVGGRKGKVDFDELGINDVVQALRDANMEAVIRDFDDKNPQEDPVIHFYELFLKEYDPKKRMQRGVFFTPRPVVSFIVRSVDEILRMEFGLADGLADTATWGEMAKRHPELKVPDGAKRDDPFVQILDPACGTGTFLVEVIDLIHQTMKAKWRKEGHMAFEFESLWNDYVSDHLLPRLYGFELMMAPYAIAHMKIGLKLDGTGYRFGSHERARVYLTNSLEPPQDFSDRFEFDAPALAHEAQAVNAIKRHERFSVVVGNPPYSNFGQLNRNPFILGLLEDYKRGLDEKKLNLDDDFIKFVRFSQYLLEKTDGGAFGMITNNSFIDGITHRVMRESLLRTFTQLHVLNLHGSSKKKEKAPDGSDDENVFDIQQGVAITLAAKMPTHNAATVWVSDVWGERASKYEALHSARVRSCKWNTPSPTPPYFFFTEKHFGTAPEYEGCMSLKNIFVVSGNGVKTERDRVSIHFTRRGIEASVHDFRTLDEGTLRQRYETGDDSRDWAVKKAKADVTEHKGQPLYRQILYRPFDFRHTWYSGKTRGFIGTPAFPTMRHMLEGNVAMITTRQTAEKFDLLCADKLVGHKSVAGYDINTAFPLFLFENPLSFDLASRERDRSNEERKRPNLSGTFLKSFAHVLQIPQESEYGLPRGLMPRDIFDYAYAVLHSPDYRSRYAEFLKIDFPRLPLTSSLELFRALAKLGGELVALHLMESPKPERAITKYKGKGDDKVSKGYPKYAAETVKINPSNGFEGVPEHVWNLHVGGYQVCEKWLKDRRGRVLSEEDIAHYQKIVVALKETIRLMAEIDTVIEAHGGWPGAFVTATKNPQP